MLTQNEIDGFVEDGYVVRRGALTEPQMASYRAAVDRVVARCEAESGYDDVRWGPGRQIWGVNNILHPDVREPDLLASLGEPAILGVISDLVGPALQHHLCSLLVNPEGMSYQCHWHRDTAFADETEEDDLLAMLLSHVQLNGALNRDHCLLIVPGSHRRRRSADERDALASDPNGDMPGQMVVELDAGDIVFYNSNLLHRGICTADSHRQTLHYAVHPYHPEAPTGGPEAQPWLTEPDFLDTLPATLRDLFANWIRCG
jgi:hypothetical protein